MNTLLLFGVTVGLATAHVDVDSALVYITLVNDMADPILVQSLAFYHSQSQNVMPDHPSTLYRPTYKFILKILRVW